MNLFDRIKSFFVKKPPPPPPINDKTISELYDEIAKWAQELKGWYARKIPIKRSFSTAVRWASIFIVVTAGLMPFIDAALLDGKTVHLFNLETDLPTLGYILLYIAGGLNLWDQFGGFSSGWLRYTSTRMEMQMVYLDFLDEWYFATYQIDTTKPVPEPKLSELKLLVDNFRDGLLALEKSETDAWATEFKNTQKELSDMVKTRTAEIKKTVDEKRRARDEQNQKNRPGTIKLVPENIDGKDKITYSLTNTKGEVIIKEAELPIYQKEKLLPNLPPQTYICHVKAETGGKVTFANEYQADLTTEKLVTITIDLK